LVLVKSLVINSSNIYIWLWSRC